MVVEFNTNGENINVSISTHGDNWFNVGSFTPKKIDIGNYVAHSGLDIDAFVGSGVILNEQYQYVKLSATDFFSFDAIGTNPGANTLELPDIVSETINTGTVSPELDIHIPSLNYQQSTGSGNENIWADFEFFEETPQGELLWKLKDFGEN